LDYKQAESDLNIKSKKEILGMSTMSHKFQITIPKEVREEKNLEAGDKVLFVKDGDDIYIKKSTEI
jgi:AbrB family looped-hinge helix DNA binding protein